MSKLQIKRGNKANLPTLAPGEFGWCVDTKEMYVGSAEGNVLLNPPTIAWNSITGKPGTFPPSSHTHNYAGSSSAGGAATTALAVPWTGVTGKPSSFTPAAHNHDASGIVSGTLPAARGGTGNTTGNASACNGLTFAVSASVPGVVNNRVTFVYG